ncbi:MAG: putative Ig domain-containing protein [Opitutaceae bacterium]|nr:putative Ig domain-containing protein [Opitutaceae bacterium]
MLQLNPATRQFIATVINLEFQPGDLGAATFTSAPVTWRSAATSASGQLYFGATVSASQAFPGLALDRLAATPSPDATVDAANLPPGLSFNAVTGIISGTPTTPGSYSVALDVAQGARTGSETLALQVNLGQLSSLDVGNVGLVGETVKVSADHYLLDGSGADIWGTADAFHYAYFPAAGQMDIKAQVVNVENSDPWSLAGVMIRADTSATSAHALVAVTPERGITFIRRPQVSGTSVETTLSGLSAPKWVRLLRRDGTVTAFYSTDGLGWSAVGGAAVSLPTAATIGLAVSAHNNSQLSAAEFSNLYIAPPAALPTAWAEGDVGNVGQTGATIYDPVDSSYVLAGSGADIWDTADSFHFTYRALSGDGQIVAKLDSIQNTDPWTMAGVMIRGSGGSDAAHAFLGITAGQRATFIRRVASGGSSADTTTYGPTAPQWLKLVRSGTTVTAYRSIDGTTWSNAGAASVTFGTVVNIGLAVCAHQNDALAAARFVHVQVSSN